MAEQLALQQFVDAAACGDIDGVRELLADAELAPEIINCVDKDGRTAFHYACLNDDVRLLAVLLAEPRVDVLRVSPRGDTGLHMAALYSSLEALRLLFADGRMPLDAQNKYGETPLHLCAGSGDKAAPRAAAMLLEHGASMSISDSYGRGARDTAKDNGENPTYAIFQAHVEAHPEIADAVDALTDAHNTWQTAPQQNVAANRAAKSAIFGQLGGIKLKKTTTTVKTMFRAGEGGTGTATATAGATQSADGRRALSKLIDFPGDKEAIAGHLANSAKIDPAGADSYGLTALHKFASWNKVEYIEMLLPHLSPEAIGAKDPEGKNALHWAVEMASVGAVKALVRAGINVEERDGKGHTVGEILDNAGASGVIERLKAAIANPGEADIAEAAPAS